MHVYVSVSVLLYQRADIFILAFESEYMDFILCVHCKSFSPLFPSFLFIVLVFDIDNIISNKIIISQGKIGLLSFYFTKHVQ